MEKCDCRRLSERKSFETKLLRMRLVPRRCLVTHYREALPRQSKARGRASQVRAFPGGAWERGNITRLRVGLKDFSPLHQKRPALHLVAARLGIGPRLRLGETVAVNCSRPELIRPG